ncbi:MAG: hypothetical protein M3O36_13650 [Myxococcota bacterium]|nr:hypothetical protein [Myxococcota bacterium]
MNRRLRVLLPAAWLGASALVAGCGSDDVAAPGDAGRDVTQTDSPFAAEGGGRDGTVTDGGARDGNAMGDGASTDAVVGDGSLPGDGSTDGGVGIAVDAADGGGPLEFTVFAKQLILTQTSDLTTPTTTEDKVFVDTPPPGVFPPSFFP